MNLHEPIDIQFREATASAEQQDFDSMDIIWQKVEEKLADQEPRRLVWKPLYWVAAAALVAGLGATIWFAGTNKDEVQHFVQQAPAAADTPRQKAIVARPAMEGDSSRPRQRKVSQPTLIDKLSPDEPWREKPVNRKVQRTINPSKPKAASRALDPAVVIQSPAVLPPAITVMPGPASLQPLHWVHGQLVDDKGQPLPGATVTIAGTRNGTTTDQQGRFTLETSGKENLDIAMIGFENLQVRTSDIGQRPIVMAPSTSSLSDVVVMGYSSQKRKSVTGSVTTITGKAMGLFNYGKAGKTYTAQGSGLQNTLVGKMAGVQVNGNKAYREPGNEIRVRGISSLSGKNQPLVVVNGKLMSYQALQSIDPGNIQRIDVLKDANASAIYGSRGANGVILLTTKNLSRKQWRRIEKLQKDMQEKGIPVNTGASPAEPGQPGAEAYDELVENPFTTPASAPLSTFSIDVDNASYTNIRRFINLGQPVPKGSVRVEEMINFFKYNLPAPADNDPFTITTTYSDAPWNPAHKLLKIGLQAKDIAAGVLPPSNLVFLVDVSGSMSDANKLPLLKQAMEVLVKELREQDKVSVVVYAGAAGLVLPPTSGAQKETILKALNRLSAGGSTAGGQGIELAYKTAQEHFMPKGNNRVILATDGDFNVGLQSNTDMVTLIENKRKSGVFLTVLGFGMGNYKDDKLELLADKGNGNYAYIDNLVEANRFLGKAFKGSMFTIAKDVKLQIEFNPQQVQAYRLIGYENRLLAAEDFANDTVDAGEMGVGHTVTALYEIIPAGVQSSMAPVLPALRCSTPPVAGKSKSLEGELATIKYRYKKPSEDRSTEKSQTVAAQPLTLTYADDDYRFAAAVAWFGLMLRQSTLITVKDKAAIISLAKTALASDDEGYRSEFVRLVEAARL